MTKFRKLMDAALACDGWRGIEIEKAVAEAATVAEWQEAIKAFGEREIGDLIARQEWADETLYGPCEGEGMAMIRLGDGMCVATQWWDSGRTDVDIITQERWDAIQAAHEAEADEAEEDEAEEHEAEGGWPA